VASMYQDYGHYEMSITIYKNALKLDPINPTVLTQLGACLIKLNK
jgi:hypothetical protein